MRTVRADEVGDADGLLAVRSLEGRGHPVVVLLEADQPDVALDRGAECGEPFPQDPLGLVLRDADEPERDVRQRWELEPADLLTVHVGDLPGELDGGVEDLSHDAHPLEDLQGARLDADGLGVLRRFEQLVDDAAVDATAPQLDGGGQPDGAGSGDEDVSGSHGRTPSSKSGQSSDPEHGAQPANPAGDSPQKPGVRILGCVPHESSDQVIVITGAAGRIGGFLRARLARPDRVLRLLDSVPPTSVTGREEAFVGSATDRDLVGRAVAGADAVVHLAGIPTEAPWPDILDVNVTGTQTVLHAAAETGVRTVVVASSNHAAGFWEKPRDGSLLPDDAAPRPDSFYGWSKAAVESLGRLYHERYGLTVVNLRIGWCSQHPYDRRGAEIWLSPDDVGRLVEAAVAPTGDRVPHRLGRVGEYEVMVVTRRWRGDRLRAAGRLGGVCVGVRRVGRRPPGRTGWRVHQQPVGPAPLRIWVGAGSGRRAQGATCAQRHQPARATPTALSALTPITSHRSSQGLRRPCGQRAHRAP